jgi:hypothetical protein
MGEEMFVIWQLGKCELAFGHDLNVVHVYNEMHARYIVWVEWGIGGLKSLLEILSFAISHYANGMQLIVVCNYKFGIV